MGDESKIPHMTDQRTPTPEGEDRPYKPGLELHIAVQRFAGALAGLRDLQEQIAPHAAKLDEEAPRASLRLRMTREEADQIRPLVERLHSFHEYDDEAKASNQGTLTDGGGLTAPAIANGSDEATEELQEVSAHKSTPSADDIRAKSKEDEEARREAEDALRANPTWQTVVARGIRESPPPTPARHGLLLNSLVTTAVSAFEVLIARIYEVHARLHPESMGQEQISVGDLLVYESIQDAVDEALSRKVDAFLRRSFLDWCKWFQDQLKISAETIAIDWSETVEVFERRNVLVHNDGRVSRQYRERIGSGEVGTRLKVDDAYVSHALDHLFVLGCLLGLLTWIKLLPGELEDACGQIHATMWESMVADRWRAVEAITRAGCSVNPPEATRLVFRVNYWQARGRIYGVESIRADVGAWDVSALSARYQLAKSALLGDADQTFKLAASAVAHDHLTANDLRTWPLLEGLRDHPDFPVLLETADEQAQEDADEDDAGKESEGNG